MDTVIIMYTQTMKAKSRVLQQETQISMPQVIVFWMLTQIEPHLQEKLKLAAQVKLEAKVVSHILSQPLKWNRDLLI